MRLIGLAVIGLVVGLIGGLVGSEIIGIVGVVVFGQEVGIKYLPVLLGGALAIGLPLIDRGRRAPRNGGRP